MNHPEFDQYNDAAKALEEQAMNSKDEVLVPIAAPVLVWLIEKEDRMIDGGARRVMYWAADCTWTCDANGGLWFARESDAQTEAGEMTGNVRVRQHMMNCSAAGLGIDGPVLSIDRVEINGTTVPHHAPVHSGLDLARPGSDETVETVVGIDQAGADASSDSIVEVSPDQARLFDID